MPKFRSTLIAAISLGVLAIPAAAQVADGQGVTVDLGGAELLHRSAVQYPATARAKGTEGTVVMDLTLDLNGAVTDMNVISGPDELRRVVMQSVLDWHFGRGMAGARRQIKVSFKPPVPPPNPGGTLASIPKPPTGAIAAGTGTSASAMAFPRVSSIEVVGLPDSARDELLAKLPLKTGDVPSVDTLNRMSAAVKAFDEHLSLQLAGGNSSGMQIRIVPPGTPQPVIQQVAATTVTAEDPQRPRVSAKVVNKVAPQYPPLAKEARIAGSVILDAVISKEGRVQNLTTVSGHPLLVQAALEAVRQWEFEPTLLNGSPAEVKTQITVNFQLPDQTAAK